MACSGAARVAVELGLGEQVGAAVAADLEPAGSDAGSDGGDAEADIVEALAGHKAGTTKLLDLGRAGGIGPPLNALRDRLAQLVQRSLAAGDFLLQPKHRVPLEGPPERGARISPAPPPRPHRPAPPP